MEWLQQQRRVGNLPPLYHLPIIFFYRWGELKCQIYILRFLRYLFCKVHQYNNVLITTLLISFSYPFLSSIYLMRKKLEIRKFLLGPRGKKFHFTTIMYNS